MAGCLPRGLGEPSSGTSPHNSVPRTSQGYVANGTRAGAHKAAPVRTSKIAKCLGALDLATVE